MMSLLLLPNLGVEYTKVEYGLLLSDYSTFIFSCSVLWTWSSHWQGWVLHAAVQLALQDIDARRQRENVVIPYRTHLFRNYVDTGWIVLHLKPIIQHHTPTRYLSYKVDSKYLMSVDDDSEYFGSCPLRLIFFIFSDHVEINPTVSKSIQAHLLFIKVVRKPFVNWLSLREIISGLTANSLEIIDWIKAFILCIMFGAWMQ